MRNRGSANSNWLTISIWILAVVGLIAAVGYQVYMNRFGASIRSGSATVGLADASQIHAFVNATALPVDGNYDSVDMPRGATFMVPLNQQLAITGMIVTSDTTLPVTVEIGVAREHVEDSGSAPAGAQLLATFLLPAGSGVQQIPLSLTAISSGSYPYVRISGTGGNWPGPITLTGVLR